MGSYGIGIGRLLACVAEEHHDEHGLIWPVTRGALTRCTWWRWRARAAPRLRSRPTRCTPRCTAAGVEVLYDDREESPGVKFNDADLIGLPLRLTVSERALKAGGVELKRRDQAEKRIVAHEDVISRCSRGD